MQHRRFDWHESIKATEGEYLAARHAFDALSERHRRGEIQLRREIAKSFQQADKNLEGTYIVRLFATFEAALRSFDRFKCGDPDRQIPASVLIDTISGRRGLGIEQRVRDGAHAVRMLRNFWAHEGEVEPQTLSIAAARARLQLYLSALPEEWN